jgi:hypothetical protein
MGKHVGGEVSLTRGEARGAVAQKPAFSPGSLMFPSHASFRAGGKLQTDFCQNFTFLGVAERGGSRKVHARKSRDVFDCNSPSCGNFFVPGTHAREY